MKNLQNNKEKMVRPWVELSLSQREKLKRPTEKGDKALSEIAREAVRKFAKRKNFPIKTAASYLPKGTTNKYKSVSAYFARSDWNLLQEISKNTGKCKSKLIRQAVDEYLGN